MIDKSRIKILDKRVGFYHRDFDTLQNFGDFDLIFLICLYIGQMIYQNF